MPNLFSSDILSILTTVGVVAVGVGYITDRLFTGRRQHTADMDNAQEKLIKTLTEQLQAQQQINDSLTAQIHEMQEQLKSLSAEVNHLKGLNEANEKKIQEYLQIIAFRNPDLDQTLAEITQVVHKVGPFMEEMQQSHATLRTMLESLSAKRRQKVTYESA